MTKNHANKFPGILYYSVLSLPKQVRKTQLQYLSHTQQYFMGTYIFVFSSDQDYAFEASLLTTPTYHTLFYSSDQAECANWVSLDKTEVQEAFQEHNEHAQSRKLKLN